MGSPAGAANFGSNYSYQPQYQGQSDTNFNQLINQITGSAGNLPGSNPATLAYGQALGMNPAIINSYLGAGHNILNTAFDPQQALYQRTQQQVMDQSNAAGAAAGVGSTPYGASVTSNALGNFDTNWQNQQLARQQQGLQGFGQAATGAERMLIDQAGLGMGAYAPLQDLLSPLTNYLNTGQNAALNTAAIGQQGFNQQMQGFQGIGSLLGPLAMMAS